MKSALKVPDRDPFDGYSLRDYRFAAAKLIKLLIRARAANDPNFRKQKKLFDAWHLTEIAAEQYSSESLLVMAEAAHDHLWRTYIGPNGSGGVDLDDPRADLKELVVRFALNPPFSEVLARIRGGKKVNWLPIASWGTLRKIRAGLDLLPGDEEAESTPAIKLGDKEKRQVFVKGKEKYLRTAKQFDVINALHDAFPDTLTGDQLVTKSGMTDAVNGLKRIAKRDAHFAAAIKMPGKTGHPGYGLFAYKRK